MRSLIVILTFFLFTPTLHAQQNCLAIVNAQRAQLGLYPFISHPQLQRQAEAEIVAMAHQGRFTGHLRGRWAGPRPGRVEGVGYRSLRADPHGYRFYTCDQANTRFRYAGAATSTDGRNRYYILILR